MPFESARDFLDQIRLSHQQWGRAPTSTWIFRGQGNASWGLVPRAWRSPGKELVKRLAARSLPELLHDAERLPSLVRFVLSPQKATLVAAMEENEFIKNVRGALLQTAGELRAIDQFVELADNVGLHIPSTGSSELQEYLSRLRHVSMTSVFEGDNSWLSHRPNDAFGLAQHHGVPTRLIDFTRNPLVAAFFAVQGVEGDRIAVWAVDGGGFSPSSSIDLMTCRRYDNSFLHAQDGLFLWDMKATDTFIATGVWPTLDAVMTEEEQAMGEELILKLTLPASEAQPLLRLLWRERVSLSHLMPSYDNIAKSLPLPDYWDQVEGDLEV